MTKETINEPQSTFAQREPRCSPCMAPAVCGMKRKPSHRWHWGHGLKRGLWHSWAGGHAGHFSSAGRGAPMDRRHCPTSHLSRVAQCLNGRSRGAGPDEMFCPPGSSRHGRGTNLEPGAEAGHCHGAPQRDRSQADLRKNSDTSVVPLRIRSLPPLPTPLRLPHAFKVTEASP